MTKKPAKKPAAKAAIPKTGKETFPDQMPTLDSLPDAVMEESVPEPTQEPTQEPVQEPEIRQRKVSRGSRRRIIRALDQFEEAVKDVCKELDRQMFEADADGNRLNKWDLVDATEGVPAHIRGKVMAVLNQE